MHNSRRVAGVLVLLLGMAAGMAAPGCGGKPERPAENPTPKHLRTLGQAYMLANLKGRVPHNAEELKPFLKELVRDEDPEVYLRSPNDGQPYEVAWGMRLDRESDGSKLFAYEKQGVGGKRYVMTVARIVQQMDDAEFQVAIAAAGKKTAALK